MFTFKDSVCIIKLLKCANNLFDIVQKDCCVRVGREEGHLAQNALVEDLLAKANYDLTKFEDGLVEDGLAEAKDQAIINKFANIPIEREEEGNRAQNALVCTQVELKHGLAGATPSINKPQHFGLRSILCCKWCREVFNSEAQFHAHSRDKCHHGFERLWVDKKVRRIYC